MDLSILSDGTDSVQKNRQTALSSNSVKSINYRILSTHIFTTQTYLINRLTLYIINLDKYTQNK